MSIASDKAAAFQKHIADTRGLFVLHTSAGAQIDAGLLYFGTTEQPDGTIGADIVRMEQSHNRAPRRMRFTVCNSSSGFSYVAADIILNPDGTVTAKDVAQIDQIRTVDCGDVTFRSPSLDGLSERERVDLMMASVAGKRVDPLMLLAGCIYDIPTFKRIASEYDVKRECFHDIYEEAMQ